MTSLALLIALGGPLALTGCHSATGVRCQRPVASAVPAALVTVELPKAEIVGLRELEAQPELLAHSHGVAVLFLTDPSWCKACRKMAPVIEACSAGKGSAAAFVTIDVNPRSTFDRWEALAGGGLPCFVIAREGRIVAIHRGLNTRAQVEGWVADVK